jgi:hypothetical protein
MTSNLWRAGAFAMAVAVTFACGQQPVGPSAVVPATDVAGDGLSAKPSGSATYTTTFSGSITGAGPLTGSMTGTAGTPGTLRGQVTGNYTWTIGPLLNGGFCNGAGTDTLTAQGLIGSPIAGSLTLAINERDSFGERIDFRMTGVSGPQLVDAWEISGHTTVDYPAVISGSANAVTVQVSQALIGFRRNPRGKVAADEVITCAVAFTATLTNP